MSYPKQLLRLQPTRGLSLDVADHETGPEFWTLAENVQFRDGFATRTLGNKDSYKPEIAAALSPITNIWHVINANQFGDGANWWVLFQGDGRAHAIQSGVTERIDGVLLTAPDEPWQFSSVFLNNIPIFSNSKDIPYYWVPGGNIQELPGWFAAQVPRFVTALKFHAFAFGISGGVAATGENLVRWSAATEPNSVPSTWVPQADNDAGFVELSDSPGIILAAQPLNDSLYFYKNSSIYQARYVGGQNVFSFRKVDSARGVIAPRGVCNIGSAHFVVGDGDIYLTDGTNTRSIGESRVRDFLFDNLDDDNFFNLYTVYNRPRGEVEIAFPSKGNRFCDVALTYDISRDSWGLRSLVANDNTGPIGIVTASTHAALGFVRDEEASNVWANRPEPWEQAVGTWSSGTVSAAKESLVVSNETQMIQTDLNTPYRTPARLGRSGIDFGEPERVKFVKRVHVRTRDPFIKMFIRVGGQFEPNGPITWSNEVELESPQQIVNCFAQGRYIAVEVRTDDTALWKVTGIDLEAEIRGYF